MASVVIGDKELLRKLDKLDQIKIDSVMRKQAEVVRAAAVYAVPVATGELRSSIHTAIEHRNGGTQGIVYTNKEYAPYVEFGTGPVGQAHHAGIDPDVDVSYRQTPWVYKSQKDGKYYYTKGQPARPYMYPALKNNEKRIIKGFKEGIQKEIEKVTE